MPQIWRTQRPHALIKTNGHGCPEADSGEETGATSVSTASRKSGREVGTERIVN